MAILVILLLTLNKLMLVVYPPHWFIFLQLILLVSVVQRELRMTHRTYHNYQPSGFWIRGKKSVTMVKQFEVSKGTLNSSKIRPSDFNFLTHIVKYRKKIIKNNYLSFQTEYFQKAYNYSDQLQLVKCFRGQYFLSVSEKCCVGS